MHIIKNKKGFSLVEVLISIAILTTLAVSFLPLFGISFENIFLFGERDRASSFISDKFESLYTKQPYSSEDDLIEEMEPPLDEEGKEINDKSDLYQHNDNDDYNAEYDFNFFVSEPIKPGDDFDNEGYKVTIVAFYENGEHYVERSSFIRGEPDD